MEFYHKKFKTIRKELRWSTVGLAKELNISRPTLSKWENGHQVPNVENMYKVAEVLGVGIDEFSDLPVSVTASKDSILESVNIRSLPELTSVDMVTPCINDIVDSMKKLEGSLKDTQTIIKTLLFYTNNIIYVKDVNSKYIIANKAYLDMLNLKEDYIIKGKTDSDFFSRKEVEVGLNEEKEILFSGTPILNKERHIPGTRNQRWGIFSKIPIFDDSKKIIGILGIVNDITERKREEEYLKTLEYALAKLEFGVWIGKGLNLSKELPLYKELLYTSRPTNYQNSSIYKAFFGTDDLNKYSLKDYHNFFQTCITEESKKELIKLKEKNKYPVERSYVAVSPITNKKLLIEDSVTFEKMNETFIGVIRKVSIIN